MSGEGKFISGLLLGLGLGYMLDPDRGARRRALVRDKVTHASRKLADGAEATATNLRNRASGAAAELRSKVSREEVGDEILHERVRSAIGRAVSHPGAVTVSTHEGRVTLQGQVLQDELNDLLRTTRQVRGVSEVVNELEVHPDPGNTPALQTGGRGAIR
jgi:osmotically-inducible protein OsmY